MISGCSSVYEPLQKKAFLNKENTSRFTGVTNLNASKINNNFSGSYVYLIPEVKNNQKFNIYYQLGVMRAYETLEIENNIRFVEEIKINANDYEKVFFIGPFKRSLVEKYSSSMDKDNFLFMNYSEAGKFIPTSNIIQINVIDHFFSLSEGYKFNVIASKNEIDKFQKLSTFPYQQRRDNLNFYSISSPEKDIPEILEIDESNFRFQLLNNKDSKIFNHFPRARSDIKNILLIPQNEEELYELASLIRFNYGLEYNILSLSYNLSNTLSKSELEIHNVKSIDVSYSAPFKFDLNKNRSFSIGYDAMLLSFAIKNRIYGEIRGFNGIYYLDKDGLIARSYIN